jgi:hypothetical protein
MESARGCNNRNGHHLNRPPKRKNRHDLSEDKDRRQWKEETHREEEQVEVIDTSVAPLVMGKKKLDLIV